MIENQEEQKVKDVRELISAGRAEEEHFVEGFNVRMHTLTGDETIEAFSASGRTDDLAHAQALRTEVITRAIITINNVALETLYKGPENLLSKDEKRNKIIKRRWLVGQWQQSFINRLYTKYLKMYEAMEKVGDDLGE